MVLRGLAYAAQSISVLISILTYRAVGPDANSRASMSGKGDSG